VSEYYVFIDDSLEAGEYVDSYPTVTGWVWVCPKTYFEQTGYIDDRHLTSSLTPEQADLLGGELMEACFELTVPVLEFLARAPGVGFTYLGPFSARRAAHRALTS
jgi:hypothetical protein